MSWLASLKIVLISSGVVALALAMKLSFPVAMEFLESYVPVMCASFKSLLRPPYIYVLINGIIITIAATSRFHHDRSPPPPKLQSESDSRVSEMPAVYEQRDRETLVYEFTPADMANGSVDAEAEAEAEVEADAEAEAETEVDDDRFEDKLAITEVEDDRFEDKLAIMDSAWSLPEIAIKTDDEIAVANSTWKPPKSAIKPEDEVAGADSTWAPPRRADKFGDEFDLPAAKPLVSARFGHRKPIRSSPEAGRPLRVAAKPKRHETLENTWKMITEGRSMPLSRHMKTWENQGRQMISVDVDTSMLDTSTMVKSETLTNRTNQRQLPAAAVTSTSTATSGVGGGKLRKEPSLGQDDLNRRVEAFIKNFNEEMKLQREASLNQYKEMVSSGNH